MIIQPPFARILTLEKELFGEDAGTSKFVWTQGFLSSFLASQGKAHDAPCWFPTLGNSGRGPEFHGDGAFSSVLGRAMDQARNLIHKYAQREVGAFSSVPGATPPDATGKS